MGTKTATAASYATAAFPETSEGDEESIDLPRASTNTAKAVWWTLFVSGLPAAFLDELDVFHGRKEPESEPGPPGPHDPWDIRPIPRAEGWMETGRNEDGTFDGPLQGEKAFCRPKYGTGRTPCAPSFHTVLVLAKLATFANHNGECFDPRLHDKIARHTSLSRTTVRRVLAWLARFVPVRTIEKGERFPVRFTEHPKTHQRKSVRIECRFRSEVYDLSSIFAMKPAGADHEDWYALGSSMLEAFLLTHTLTPAARAARLVLNQFRHSKSARDDAWREMIAEDPELDVKGRGAWLAYPLLRTRSRVSERMLVYAMREQENAPRCAGIFPSAPQAKPRRAAHARPPTAVMRTIRRAPGESFPDGKTNTLGAAVRILYAPPKRLRLVHAPAESLAASVEQIITRYEALFGSDWEKGDWPRLCRGILRKPGVTVRRVLNALEAVRINDWRMQHAYRHELKELIGDLTKLKKCGGDSIDPEEHDRSQRAHASEARADAAAAEARRIEVEKTRRTGGYQRSIDAQRPSAFGPAPPKLLFDRR